MHHQERGLQELKEGGMHEKIPIEEQGGGRSRTPFEGLQTKRSLGKRSDNEEKVLIGIKSLMFVVRKMSSIGRSGKGLRWRISQ